MKQKDFKWNFSKFLEAYKNDEEPIDWRSKSIIKYYHDVKLIVYFNFKCYEKKHQVNRKTITVSC